MRITLLTLFPRMFDSFLSESILGRAIRQGLLTVEAVDLRSFSARKHKNTDDEPFGGGAGMVMLAQPILDAMACAAPPGCGARRIFLSPRGRPFTQRKAEALAGERHLVLLCGHYEGVDQRAIDLCVDEELSVGDYVLTGGETAAMAVVDAVARLLPGVLGSPESAWDESFTSGLLEYPQYTRPREIAGLSVPEVLLGGNHAEILKWRRREALRVTWERRPDLLGAARLTAPERETVRGWGTSPAEHPIKEARIMSESLGFSTLQVQAGYTPEKTHGAFAPPIYQTVGFQFDGVEDAVAQFSLEKPGSIYTRLANPTVAVLEKRICALEGGVGTVCFASGMAALLAAIQNLAESGSEIIAMSAVYGGTFTLFFDRLERRYGIRARRVDIEDLRAVEDAVNEKTRLVFIETLGNPMLNIPDMEAVAEVAHRHGLPLVADNTFGTPYLIDLKAHGVDFTVHSLSKYIGGHGNTVGGSVTELGTFSFKENRRFEDFNRPDACYHGLVYADLPVAGYTAKLRAGFLRDTGACLSPMNAFLLLMGLETLSLRMARHSESTLAVARWLKAHPAVDFVRYPGLPGDDYYALGQKYFPEGAGGILSFNLRGGLEAGKALLHRLRLFSFVAHVADVRSMVTHPASSTHSQLSEQDMKKTGITPGLVRVSVGLEDVKDLIADLQQGLEGL